MATYGHEGGGAFNADQNAGPMPRAMNAVERAADRVRRAIEASDRGDNCAISNAYKPDPAKPAIASWEGDLHLLAREYLSLIRQPR